MVVVPAALRRAARLLTILLVVIGSIVAWRLRGVLDPVAITAAIARHPAAPLWFLAAHIIASLLFVPRTLLAIVAGMLFGVAWGIIWAEVGGVAGAAAGFLIGRYINSGRMEFGQIARFRPVIQRVERGGWRAVAFLRLIPVLPHGIANYGLALTGLGFGAFAFGSLLGQLPMTVVYVGLGAAGGRVLRGTAGWAEPTLIGLAALSLSVLIPAFSRWRTR